MEMLTRALKDGKYIINRERKIASMLSFVAFFGRFLGIIQVARLEMCKI
jgi:hypothetical protein